MMLNKLYNINSIKYVNSFIFIEATEIIILMSHVWKSYYKDWWKFLDPQWINNK